MGDLDPQPGWRHFLRKLLGVTGPFGGREGWLGLCDCPHRTGGRLKERQRISLGHTLVGCPSTWHWCLWTEGVGTCGSGVTPEGVYAQVLEDGHQWWKLRTRSGQAGYVPHNILAETRPEDLGAPQEQVMLGLCSVPHMVVQEPGGRGRCCEWRGNTHPEPGGAGVGALGVWPPGQWGPGQVLGGGRGASHCPYSNPDGREDE